MGDVAMTVPVIKELIKTYPNTKITIVSKPFFEPIFKGIENVTFVAADVKGKHKGIPGLYKLFKQLKKTRITHVADLHNVLRSKIVRSFFKTAGTPIAFIDKGRAKKKELTKNAPKTIQQLKTTHQRYADVFDELGFTIELQPAKRDYFQLNNNIVNLVGEKEKTWIGIAPFAAFEGKMYPLKLMKEVLLELSKLPCQLLLFGGGKNETEQLNKLSLEISNSINMAGKLTFEEELHLISNLDIMISMDSGNAHLAAMFGVDTLTIWGVTHPYAGFAPYMQSKSHQILPILDKYPLLPCSVYGNKVFEGYEDVMKSITPKKIALKTKELLEKSSLCFG